MLGTFAWYHISHLHKQSAEAHDTHLSDLVLRRLGKDSVQQRDSINQHLGAADFHTVTNVIGMLDKEENTGAQELLSGNSKDE